ncbi:uncharacterized protein LOC144665030 [Oculina patagonica]
MDFDNDTLKAIAQVYKEEGNVEYRKNEFRNALGFYTEGIDVNCKDDKLSAILYTNRATAHFSLGDFQEALEDAKQAREFQPTYIKAIFRGAKACKELRLYEEAIKWCDDGLAIEKENQALMEVKRKSVDELTKLSKEKQPYVENKRALQKKKDTGGCNQGISSFIVDNPERVMKVFNQCSALAKELRDATKEGTAFDDLGTAYHMLRQPEEAREYFTLYYAICKGPGDRKGKIWACHNLVSKYEDDGDLTEAIKYYKECLNMCNDEKYKIEERATCTNLGNAYYKLGEYKVALELYQRSLTLCKELGDRPEEGRENAHTALMYKHLNDFKNAREHNKINLHICQEVRDQCGEADACCRLGVLCIKAGDFKQAEEYIEKGIQISKELKDEAVEGKAWHNLGVVHYRKGNFSQAIKSYNRALAFSLKVRDRAFEGTVSVSLGNAYFGLGDIKRAIAYFEETLVISKQVRDRDIEKSAYGSLGKAHGFLGNYTLAIQYQNQCLTICKELRDRHGEGAARSDLGVANYQYGNYKQAIEFHKESLTFFQDLGDKAGVGAAFRNLGNVYRSLGEFKQAAEYYNRSLTICKETGERANEATIFCNLGCTFLSLGVDKEAVKFFNRHLAICKELGDRAGEGLAYGNLSIVYCRLRKYEEAINYHKLHLSIFKEIGDKAEEGKAYRDLGIIQTCLGDFEHAEECCNKYLAISKEIGDRAGEGEASLELSEIFLLVGDVHQAMEFSKQHQMICKETGDICGEGRAYLCQAQCLKDSGFLSDAVVLFQSSVQQFNHARSLLHSKDAWKISLRNEYRMAYTKLWNVLLELDRTDEALLAAEKGRAQALIDLLVSQYGFEEHQHDQVSQEKTPGELLTCALSNTVFLAVYGHNISKWLLQDGKNIHFCKQNVDTGVSKLKAGKDLDSFIKKAYKEIGVRSGLRCEDRSLDALDNKDDLTVQEPDLLPSTSLPKMRFDGKTESRTPSPVQKNCLSALYDVIVAPVFHQLRGNELVIVPDGPLFLVPFAALQDAESRYLCEFFRIRVIPSLTCLKMIMDAPPDHHCKSGALIVGDPWVQEVVDLLGKPKLVQLPGARKEAEMIGEIVNSLPLTGSDATKEEVLSKLNSVALIHLAAHGRIATGEIALAPNTSRKSPNPSEEDFLLTMSDVLSVGLRARLVVLSCCHSGRGEIKDEGVVGIARAFLGAGARFVLVSLWALEDEATLEFMRVFYENLVKGKKASEALNCATNYMRESKEFGEIRQWAPFVLIGDDVTLECFEGKYICLQRQVRQQKIVKGSSASTGLTSTFKSHIKHKIVFIFLQIVLKFM